MSAVLSRRGVLGAGTLAVGFGLASGVVPATASTAAGLDRAAAASASASGAASAPGGDPLVPVRSLFADREGTVFTGFSQWSVQSLTLTVVADIAGGGDPEHSFVVRFATDEGARDGIYRLTDGDTHVASLFLARVGADGQLEGIVNREVSA